ncbi:hypothetical protein [Winogradskyella sp.]|uniref:hypothetical protein n=1 Tax=Winogradskyella sp. TaxID=1883156 RepID=UPI002611BF31|nr:hypothetical protein [Winogradskyella sp.]
MKFTQRLAYYLSGFAIGLVILMFFLNGKDASCDYGPNARTVKNISSKPIAYSDEAKSFIDNNALDSLTIVKLIKFGNVDFSKSNTKLDSCNIYHIDNSYKERDIELTVENCDSLSTIFKINYLK